jgi:hypothetical protein
VLKKVGIVAAAATAAMIALSPLAFADHDDHDGDRDRDRETTNVWIEENGEERNQSNECEFSQEVSNASGLVPVELLVTQTQSDNCTNLGDDAEISEPAPAPVLPIIG